MHRCFAPAADGSAPVVELPAGEAHHLVRVLRLGTGADLIAFNGRGAEWAARLVAATKTTVRIELVAPREPVVEPPVHLTLAMALLGGGDFDEVVRDATMLGVAAVAPVRSAHVALPNRARDARSLERWERVAVASAKQCGRAVVPAIHPVADFETVLATTPAEMRIVCAEPALASGGLPLHLPRPSSALVCVGPEGGWSAGELALAERHGARPVQLGPRRLRASAAPTVALAALWTLWEWTRAAGDVR